MGVNDPENTFLRDCDPRGKSSVLPGEISARERKISLAGSPGMRTVSAKVDRIERCNWIRVSGVCATPPLKTRAKASDLWPYSVFASCVTRCFLAGHFA